MSRTINGKTLEQVQGELKKDFPDNVFKQKNGNFYLPIEVIRERMDEIIGIFNYDFIQSDARLIQTGEQQNITIKGILIIKDDLGNIVTRKCCSGSSTVTYPNVKDNNNNTLLQDGKPVKQSVPSYFSNTLESAGTDAFKRCCKMIGIGFEQLSKKNDQKQSNSQQYQNHPQDVTFNVKILSEFVKKGSAYICDVQDEAGEKYELIIWNNVQKIIEKTCPMDKFIKSYTPNKFLKFKGYKKNYNGVEQIVMKTIGQSKKEACA